MLLAGSVDGMQGERAEEPVADGLQICRELIPAERVCVPCRAPGMPFPPGDSWICIPSPMAGRARRLREQVEVEHALAQIGNWQTPPRPLPGRLRNLFHLHPHSHA